MTTMTLRISGKNSGNSAKLHGDHKKIHVIKVDESFVNEARMLDKDCYCVSSEVEKLKTVETVEEQLKILKLMAKSCSINDLDQENKLFHFCLKLLTEFYLTATPKNPLKNAIPRLLSTFPQSAHDDITSHLSCRLSTLMKTTLQNKGGPKEMNAIVCTISCCFTNNFAIGIKSVGHAILTVIMFTKTCLSTYVKELGQNIALAAKQDICQFSHMAMQTLVSVLQKCQPFIRSQMSACEVTELASSSENGTGGAMAFMLTELQHLPKIFLDIDNCPMNMKANCGLVVVLLAMYLEGDKGWRKLLVQEKPQKDAVQLCMCMGVLNALSKQQLLLTVPEVDTSVLWCVFTQVVNISGRVSASSSMVLATSRAMLLLSRDVVLCVQSGGATAALPHERLQEALVFVWTHLEHYMDAVRHAVHATFLNYVKAAAFLRSQADDDGKAINTIMESVMNIPPFKKSRYVGLSTLAREIGCQMILERVPCLVEDLISSMDDPAVSTSVSGAFETLMLRHQDECKDVNVWVQTWLLPVLNRLAPAVLLEIVLSKAVKCCPAVIPRLLRMDTDSLDCDQLRAILTCVRMGRKQGVLPADSEQCEDKWKGILQYSLLEGALWHRSEQIRVCALSLLVESHRSTEALSGSDLQLVRTFLEYNINTQSPATRQQALALIKKLLVRLRDSSAVLARAAEQATKSNVSPASSEPDPTAQLKTYNTFLLWGVDFCLASLFPGANFGHRGSALQILVYIQELVGFEPSDPVWRHSPPDMWTNSNADTLLECLKDTYEKNKSLAFSLLVKFPAEALGLNDEDYVCLLLDAGCKMAASNRPPDCITAAYLLKLLASFPAPVATLAAQSGDAASGALFYMVHRLEVQLSKELEVARKSIAQAAAKGPMYGTLCCIRYLMKDVDLRELCGDSSWRDMITRLITLGFQLNGVVSCIVNSFSPEGNLPMDFLPAMKEDENAELPVQNVTAQMLLLCSWRTVKEVSLFLGELSERAPIITEGSPECGLMTEEQVLAIGDHFTTLLSETKHRGAFEQAYIGFCQLCSRLWKHPVERLHQLPATWLAELMALIAEGGGGVLCVTRRSAGVPFMVQALVTTQLQAGGGPSCFQQSMSTLLSLASKVDGVKVRTHAFNILRALYRYSALGELVTPYVAEGVMVAIKGFRGNTWAERNSATLLFGALITRIFGVPRSRDEKLRMTGRVFFHRYPQLFDFLLEELQNITSMMMQDTIDNPQLYPSLYPVLVLLSRLYPSSLEGSDSKLQLMVYIPHVMACSHSCMMHTRALAARALVPLVTPNVYVTYLSQIFIEASAKQGIRQNRRHGLLLQIVNLLRDVTHISSVGDKLWQLADVWVSESKWLLLAPVNTSWVTQETYLRVLALLGANCFSFVRAVTWREIVEHLERTVLGKTPSCSIVGKPVFEATSTLLLLQLTISCDVDPQHFSQRFGTLLTKLLKHPEFEVVMDALRFLLSIFEDVCKSNLEDADFGLIQVRSWQPNNELCLRDEVLLHTDTVRTAAELALLESMYPLCRKLIFRLLCHWQEAFLLDIWSSVDKLETLLNLCREEHESVSYAVLISLGAFLHVHQEKKLELSISCEQASKMCRTLLEFSSPEKPELCRRSAAKVLLQNSYLLCETVPFLTDVDRCTLWTAVLVLLQDDVEAVRNMTSDLVHLVLPAPPTMPVVPHKARELLVDWFVCTMFARDPSICAVALLAWSLAGTMGEESVGQSEDRVFDKGEMNSFAEEVTVTDLCCQHLSRVVGQGGLCVETWLPPQLVCWFCQTCLGECPTPDVPTCLGGLVRLVQGRLLNSDHHDRTFHFLVPCQKTVFLSVFKVRRVVEVMLSAMA